MRKECFSITLFLYCPLKTIKMFNECVICYLHYLKSILNGDSFKEYISPVVFINSKYMLKIYAVVSIKKSLFFQLTVFKIYAIIKAVYCFNCLPWISTGRSRYKVFFEINLNLKTLKLYTSWVYWKRQRRSIIRKHTLLWNKHKYQHSAGLFVKNIFKTFHGTLLCLYVLKYVIKPEVSWSFQGA